MLQANINIIEDKAVNLGFKLSSSKTFCVHFCRLRSQHTDPQLTVNNTIIEVRPTARVLGLIFDSKLTWVSHIRDLAVRAKKSLNILRCMANIVWGSDREILLRLYMALILPKIDYGCFVYGSARQSRLRALDSIHCMALRIATGAFRTSPLTSICCEAGIPPLKFRRQRGKEEINKWKTPCKLTRREKVVLTRLRIGHSHITSFHLLRGEQQPRCASCGVLLTIKHILLECNEFNQTRQRLHVPNNLKKCLSNEKAEVKRTLTFIKEIGMFKKL